MDFTFNTTAQHLVNDILIWIGFGTLAGLLARTVLPGSKPSGAVGTIVIGVAGSTFGLFVFQQFVLGASEGRAFNPISPMGMLAATAGAFALLIVYRLLATCVLFDHPPEKPAEDEEE